MSVRWRVDLGDRKYVANWTLHTIWGYWPADDVAELHAAVDEGIWDANPDRYVELLDEARKRFGSENVREIKVQIPAPVVDTAFEPSITEGYVESPASAATNQPQNRTEDAP